MKCYFLHKSTGNGDILAERTKRGRENLFGQLEVPLHSRTGGLENQTTRMARIVWRCDTGGNGMMWTVTTTIDISVKCK